MPKHSNTISSILFHTIYRHHKHPHIREVNILSIFFLYFSNFDVYLVSMKQYSSNVFLLPLFVQQEYVLLTFVNASHLYMIIKILNLSMITS